MKRVTFLACILIVCLCGLTLAEDSTATPGKPVSAPGAAVAKLHTPLPEPLTSFGAAVQGEYLYVFSGHSGVAHGFGKDLLVNHFRRLKFDDPEAQWEELAMHEPAQSVALVSDGEYLYRVAGLSFLNSGTDSETNFNSTTHFARYDVSTNTWESLAPLPKSRSSLDAAVVGRSVYVVGGWNLQGESSRDAEWHEDILRFDLDQPESGWQSIAGPGYVTRALSVAAHDGKLYAIGGIQQRGISKQVSVFDPASSQWSEGPELPSDSSTAGFATSAFATGGNLYVTGGSGVVYRLGKDGSSWEPANRLMFPRMFLRLLPLDESRLIALGGTGSLGRTSVVESLSISSTESETPKTMSWSVEFSGRAKHSQALVLDGGKLYAFGGNASREAHDFSSEAFVDEAFVFDVGNQAVERLPDMPAAMQSGVAVLNRQTSEHKSILVAGGLGPGEDKMQYLESLYQYDPGAQTWQATAQSLPKPRSMFSAATHDDAIWMFAGSAGRSAGLSTDVLHWWGDETPIAPLADISTPTPRRSHGGAVLKNHYYMVGGLADGMKIADTVDVFDFQKRTWSHIAPPSVARVFPSLAAANGKLYLFGGFTNASGHFSPATSLEVYDLETGEWQTMADSLPGIPASMSMLGLNDRLLFYGVDEDTDGLANFVLLDPAPMAVPEAVQGMSFTRRGNRDSSEETAKMMIRKDTNKDGKLSVAELGQRMVSLIKAGDKDNDGLLSFEEAKAELKARAESEQEAASADASDDAAPAKATEATTDARASLEAIVARAEEAAEDAQQAAERARQFADEARRQLEAAQSN